MSKKYEGTDISATVHHVMMKARETEDEFIFHTIYPFCNNVVNRIMSKKELEEMLVKADRMKWIPCSERLPEEHTTVLATWKETWYSNAEERIDTLWINSDGKWSGKFGELNQNGSAEVIAWMPLPEPYRGE